VTSRWPLFVIYLRPERKGKRDGLERPRLETRWERGWARRWYCPRGESTDGLFAAEGLPTDNKNQWTLTFSKKFTADLLITPHMFVCLISLIKKDIFYLLTLNCTIVVYASSYQITKINFLLLLIVFRPK
jgi:hypothetical protein